MTPDKTSEAVAVILAAGRGTRMGKITESVPKPLVPVLDKPAIQWVIDGIAAAGVHRFVIVTGYLSEQVQSKFARYRAEELHISFVQQDEQLGTAHALKLTRAFVGTAPLLLAFADIMTSPDNFWSMINHFTQSDCAVVGGIRNIGDPWKAAAVYLDDQRNILRIIEKPPVGTSTTPYGHAGMYCFANVIYDYLERVQPSPRGELEVTDAVAMMISDGLCCQAVELTGYWKDLATPEDVIEAEELMRPAKGS